MGTLANPIPWLGETSKPLETSCVPWRISMLQALQDWYVRSQWKGDFCVSPLANAVRCCAKAVRCFEYRTEQQKNTFVELYSSNSDLNYDGTVSRFGLIWSSLGTALPTVAVLNTSPGQKNQSLLTKVCLEQRLSRPERTLSFKGLPFAGNGDSHNDLELLTMFLCVFLYNGSHGSRERSIEPSEFGSACRYLTLHGIPFVPGRETLLQILTIRINANKRFWIMIELLYDQNIRVNLPLYSRGFVLRSY